MKQNQSWGERAWFADFEKLDCKVLSCEEACGLWKKQRHVNVTEDQGVSGEKGQRSRQGSRQAHRTMEMGIGLNMYNKSYRIILNMEESNVVCILKDLVCTLKENQLLEQGHEWKQEVQGMDFSNTSIKIIWVTSTGGCTIAVVGQVAKSDGIDYMYCIWAKSLQLCPTLCNPVN